MTSAGRWTARVYLPVTTLANRLRPVVMHVTLRGTLTRMDWVNPHGWIFIDVKGPDGKVVNWAIEAGAPNALLRRGLRKTDFPIGIEVMVEGYQAKNGTPTANGSRVQFADGRNFFVGSSGTGAPSERR